ncbi:heparinase II/III domain-containing protein [Tenggerimyces flavus]|uniref:Heparinase II/III family protein n=1 Tax=Tenggerimyces flavus TaxID=1708749 RepID=A0ABV7YP90_9ACTN|nr:heparinase II/III family protein [Tenggerimyces flavus]MBM7789469.1 hypothetical protein [Tenggerimyces flavus]
MSDLGRASTKTASTFYTAEKVAAARRNIADFDWAQQVRDDARAAADPYVAKGDEWLWNLVTTQKLPRSYAVNQALGSPITGRDIYQYGNYPWRADPLTAPWKIVDPSSDYVFPTNDFPAYYTSGIDDQGRFDPARADRTKLVNQLYPDRGPTWGVDDGYGWVDDAGKKWTFVAYYNHWHTWFGDVARDTAKAAVHLTLRALRDAYVYTGDLKYAHAGLVILDRVADVYPSMDTSAYRSSQGFLNSDGGSGRGRIVGCIWETGLARELVSVYDAFFPAVATTDQANVVPFLNGKASQYGQPPKADVEAIKQNIETNLIRQIFPAIERHQIAGNFGSHQATLAMAAVVLDSPTESNPWIDWIFKAGGRVTTPELHITGGNMHAQLVGDVDRDGFGNEAAPGYNLGWITAIQAAADALSGYDRYPTADLYEHPKYAKMFEGRAILTMVNRFQPSIGDSGSTGRPILTGLPQQFTADFERYGNPVYAQMAYLTNNNSLDGLYGSIFSTDVEGTLERMRQVVESDGPLALPTVNLSGYGLASLRQGTGDAMRAAWAYYGRTAGHGHGDALNLGLYGFRTDLMPDLGYPEFADNNARRFEWNANTIAHNSVTVDNKRQSNHWVGQPHAFANTPQVKLFDLSAPKVYPQTSRYRRVTATVTIDDANWYAVDVFRVTGGTHHHLSFHAAEGPVTTTGLDLAAQPTGTYAGPDILPPADNALPRPNASGFDWLSNVSRANPEGPFTADWKIKDTWNVHDPDLDLHLRLNVLSPIDDVALCDGIPPRNKPGNPPSLRYLIAHRQGLQLTSQFVSVIEPYVGQPTIRAVTEVPVVSAGGEDFSEHDTVAVKVELTNGRTDYVVSSLRTDVLFTVDGRFPFQGGFGVYSLRNSRPVYAMGHDAARVGEPGIRRGPAALTGKVHAFTRELSADNSVTLTLDSALNDPSTLIGHYLYVANDGERNAVYRIAGIGQISGNQCEFKVGNTTTIRGYVNPDDFDLGYRYDVAVGANARIPLTREWMG